MTKPTIREVLDGVRSDIDSTHEWAAADLADRVDELLWLHARGTDVDRREADHCTECLSPWPCPTVRVLDGLP